MILKVQIKGNIDKLNLIKIESFCSSKNTSKRVKRQPTAWEKILASHIFEIGLLSRIKGLFQLKTTKQNNTIEKDKQFE